MFSLAEFYPRVVSDHWQGSITDTLGNQLSSDTCMACLDTLTQLEMPLNFGDKCLLVVDSSVHSIAWMLTLWSKGIVVVPVKTGIADSAIHAIATDCNARYLIEGSQIQCLGNYVATPKQFVTKYAQAVTGVDLALLIYTSGSTGTPKGIMLTHHNVITALSSISQYLNIQADDRILCLSPLSFDYGLYQALFALYCDCHTLLSSQSFNPMAVIKQLSNERITLLPLVPAMASALVRLLPVLKPDLSTLRGITNTGGHLPQAVIQRWKDYHPELDVYAMYGLTECKRALYLPPEHWHSKAGSVGKPVPGLEAKVFIQQGDTHIEAAVGQVGELYVRGSAVMQAYCDPQAQGGAKLHPGDYRDDNWLATGDLFCIDDDGFFYFKGRSKDLIKQAGFCLYPKDIESVLETCPLVELSAVIAAQDNNGDEIAAAIIQLQCNDKEHQQQFSAWAREHIDKDYMPREVRFADRLALTDNSKVDKRKLQQELAQESQ
ncbi:hypothetical protein CHH28_02850 [Bacterioplanes sanyensis]|uniref:AMP-dependent synthetase n=1 Tax=Bacterioplanes sanyensis TaxID=1249553 RepID=A0A222FGV8_9GAMM|nr:class I adenylate-forming enzyme family protein [Bacterioplanes sanyensis]ASP37671.1 hypothetical protein CHH28_02850 [Bacterioplanes sanyensis]